MERLINYLSPKALPHSNGGLVKKKKREDEEEEENGGGANLERNPP